MNSPAPAPSLENESQQGRDLPPMLQQYLDYKQRYSDCLLFFQVGDFYELFFEDAVTASRALNLTLTSRDRSSLNPVPMAGVPIASVEGYLSRLTSQGFSIAIVSQTQDKAQGKGSVERRLERIVTPGINILEHTGAASGGGCVAAVMPMSGDFERTEYAIAFSDVKSGEIRVRDGVALSGLLAELQRMLPGEIILPQVVAKQRLDRRLGWIRDLERGLAGVASKFRPESYADGAGRRSLDGIEGFAGLAPAGRRAARFLLSYIDEVTVEARLPIARVVPFGSEGVLAIDAVTRRTLELTANAKDGSLRGTLLAYLDRCASSPGSAVLREWILNPLTDLKEIKRRHAAVAWLKDAAIERAKLSQALCDIPDLCRIAARIELDFASPRELGALRDALARVPAITEALGGADLQALPGLLHEALPLLVVPQELRTILGPLAETPPFTTQHGDIFADGADSELDRLRQLRKSGKAWITDLETQERQRTGIASLKIKFNNVLGYFFEVTQANLAKVPEHFTRRQSTANCERFTTAELRQREQELLSAESRQLELERSMFLKLRSAAREFTGIMRRLAALLAQLDVLAALADLAEREGWASPTVDLSTDLVIQKGYHPVIAAVQKGSFVPNGVELTDKRVLLITGPNMGGKSTYLRQAGLIVVLAQIGAFVPAASARIGLVDRIFARMGASDDLSEGESTFMVEMREAANIICGAGERSLVLIDEIGRGTATADGLAIAQAILEWLVLKSRCRTFFATHFHELTALEQELPPVRNLNVAAIERGRQVIFTHEIHSGAASRSYGVEVARLAGLPSALLRRAGELLLRHGRERSGGQSDPRQLSIFDRGSSNEMAGGPDDYELLLQVCDRIEALNPDELTPLQGLTLLAELRALLKGERP